MQCRLVSRKVREVRKGEGDEKCLTYLHLLDKRLGFVINFGMPSLKDGIERIVNKL